MRGRDILLPKIIKFLHETEEKVSGVAQAPAGYLRGSAQTGKSTLHRWSTFPWIRRLIRRVLRRTGPCGCGGSGI